MEGSAPRLSISFRPREAPLAPLAAAARGAVAIALAERVLGRDDASLAELSGVSSRALLILVGATGILPWVDGVLYLGRDRAAPSLLLPTALEPDVPAPLFERALLSRRDVAAPLAVLVDPMLLVPLAGARPIDRALLTAWLAAEREGAP